MYIKINLLPKSYYEKKAAQQLMALLLVILVLVVAGLFYYKMKVIDVEIADLNKKIEYANDIKAKVESLNAEVEARRAEVAYYTKRVDFMKSVLRFNNSIPSIFQDVAVWTYEKVQYTSISTDGSSVTISARARSLDDIGRYILNLYKAQGVFANINLSIDGFGSSSGSGMGGGMMSSMPGMGTGMGSMPGMGASPMMGSGASPSMPGMGASPMMTGTPGGMAGGRSSMPGMPSMGGMTGGAGSGGSISANGIGINGWINFTINASLEHVIVAPVWSDDAPASSTTNTGMMTGMMPGMPAMGGASTPGMPSSSGMQAAPGTPSIPGTK